MSGPYGQTPIHSIGPGQTVDSADQLSSVVLMGIAIAGGALAVLLNALIV